MKSSNRRRGGGTYESRHTVEEKDIEMLTLNDFSLSLKGILSQCGVVDAPDETVLPLRDEDFHWHSETQSFEGQSFDNNSDTSPRS